MSDKISHKELLPLAVQIFLNSSYTRDPVEGGYSANSYAKSLARNFTDFYHDLCQGLAKTGALRDKEDEK